MARKKAQVIKNSQTGEVILAHAKWCASAFCHFKGLMFRFGLPKDEGLLFVRTSESKVNTAIHTLFMFMTIGVLWIDSQNRVVDKRVAKPWRLAFVPAKPALYFLEANPEVVNRVQIGDVVTFEPVA
jgi:uncharacterized membrane protein (UPF0127 family)